MVWAHFKLKVIWPHINWPHFSLDIIRHNSLDIIHWLTCKLVREPVLICTSTRVITLVERPNPFMGSVSCKPWYKMSFQAFHENYSYLNSKFGPYQFLSMQLFSLLRYSQSMKSLSLCLIIRKLDLRWPHLTQGKPKKRCINIPGYNEKLLLKASNWFHLKHSTDEKMRYTTVRKSFTPDNSQTTLEP